MSFRCDNCKNRFVQKSGDETHVRAQGRIIIKSDGTCIAQCLSCKAQIVLPLELSKAVTEERPVVTVRRQ